MFSRNQVQSQSTQKTSVRPRQADGWKSTGQPGIVVSGAQDKRVFLKRRLLDVRVPASEIPRRESVDYFALVLDVDAEKPNGNVGVINGVDPQEIDGLVSLQAESIAAALARNNCLAERFAKRRIDPHFHISGSDGRRIADLYVNDQLVLPMRQAGRVHQAEREEKQQTRRDPAPSSPRHDHPFNNNRLSAILSGR